MVGGQRIFTPKGKRAKAFYYSYSSPNITGSSMGYALDNTIQDILIRWNRMKGYHAVAPGTDHASIATEPKLWKNWRRRAPQRTPGQGKFLEGHGSGRKNMAGGLSAAQETGQFCDWTRERFDGRGCNKAVTEFCKPLREDLIYRRDRIINCAPPARPPYQMPRWSTRIWTAGFLLSTP